MITSKADYRFYLEADRIALCKETRRPRPFVDDTWKFQRLLRKVEYYKNCKRSPLHRAYFLFVLFRYHRLAQRLGFTIFPNTIGPGLCIPHRGSILISSNAQIGENCRIHSATNIGTEVRFGDRAPKLGNNVYVGPGAKLFGDIVIGDDVAIAANSVVNRSFDEPHQTVGGIPARKLSDRGTEGLLLRATEMLRAAQTGTPVSSPVPIFPTNTRGRAPVGVTAPPRPNGRRRAKAPRTRS